MTIIKIYLYIVNKQLIMLLKSIKE